MLCLPRQSTADSKVEGERERYMNGIAKTTFYRLQLPF